MTITEETSQKIKNMSLVCAILVVCIHIQRPTDCGAFLFLHWFPGHIPQIGVPFFFIASGFLLLNHFEDGQWWLKAIKRRFFTLFIPFLCLNLLWFPIKYTCHYIGYKYFGADHSDPIMEFTITNFLRSVSPIPVSGGPVIGALWYIRALIFLVIFSPLYVWLLRKSKLIAYAFVMIVGSLWFFQNTQGARFHLNGSYEYSLHCLFYFSLGITLRLWDIPKIHRSLGICSMLMGLFLSTAQNFYPTYSFLIPNSSVIFLIIGIWSLMPSAKWPPSLTRNTFVIYVVHGPLIYLGGTIYKALHFTNIATSTIGVFVSIAIYVFLSCCIGEIVRRKYPVVSKYFFGGR